MCCHPPSCARLLPGAPITSQEALRSTLAPAQPLSPQAELTGVSCARAAVAVPLRWVTWKGSAVPTARSHSGTAGNLPLGW